MSATYLLACLVLADPATVAAAFAALLRIHPRASARTHSGD